MKQLGHLILFILLYSCNDNNVNPPNKSDRNSVKSFHMQPPEVSSLEPPKFSDSAIFIRFVNDFYFLDNNEIYTEIYFTTSLKTEKEYQEIVKLGDSLI